MSTLRTGQRFCWLALAFAVSLVWNAPSLAAAAPRIAVSIPPIHSLVASVAAGVSVPALIVRGNASPHGYAMAPSDARAVQQADLVVWVGPDLETFLARSLRDPRPGQRVVTLLTADILRVLPARAGGAFEIEAHDRHADSDEDDSHHHSAAALDPHVWLNPANARAIVTSTVAALSALDPANAATYRANGDQTLARLDALDIALAQQFDAVKDRPFIVFHDAYQYLERRYGLTVAAAITVSPDRKPGARRLREIQARIAESGATCVFAEPQVEPDVIETVIAGTGARAATADLLGADLAPGPDLYFVLMTNLAQALRDCLTERP
ncbi:MAG: zinc ABC transporter substrate-binding protein [Alphaproteobacteria bacterium]|nr:zinc ABC transporter substrate-binding protein [Alphaproteobacteria bacterium]